jgi:hypothetical protein
MAGPITVDRGSEWSRTENVERVHEQARADLTDYRAFMLCAAIIREASLLVSNSILMEIVQSCADSYEALAETMRVNKPGEVRARDATSQANRDEIWEAINIQREDSGITVKEDALQLVILTMRQLGAFPGHVHLWAMTQAVTRLVIADMKPLISESKIAPLYRSVLPNPFRPVSFDPSWRTEAAVGIARGIYDDRAFERMPILADALQEAGCENQEILNHCRNPGHHVRGNWVVDLVLGKE